MSWAWPPKMLRKIWCLIGLSWSVRKDKLLSMQHVIHIPSHENSFDSLCIQKWSETIGNWHKIPWGDSIKTGRHVVSFDETGSGLWTNSFAQALEMHGDCHASQEPRCRMAMRAWETSGSIVMKVWNNFEKSIVYMIGSIGSICVLSWSVKTTRLKSSHKFSIFDYMGTWWLRHAPGQGRPIIFFILDFKSLASVLCHGVLPWAHIPATRSCSKPI